MKYNTANKTATLALLLAGVAKAAAAAVAEPDVSYDGYKVVRLPTGAGLDQVTRLVGDLGLEAWVVTRTFADVMVPPANWAAFHAETAGLGAPGAEQGGQAKTLYEDLGATIALERQQLFATPAIAARQAVDDAWFSAYHPYADHIQYLNNLVAQFPDNAELVTSGTSTEGRTITGVHIFGSSGRGVQPAIVFHGTVHAREWIATMAVEYIAYNLLANYSTDPQTQGRVDKYDFYIFPVVNPDGFVHSQTRNRLWRKNRQPQSGTTCIGRDLNRNWPYKWDVPGGSSTSPCDDQYRGEAPGDGTEMAGLTAKIQQIQAQQGLRLFIDFHSYGEFLMSPYGWDCSARVSNNDELQSLAGGAVAAIAQPFGTNYTAGPLCPTLYQVSGGSIDYVYDVVQVPRAYIVELRDQGDKGFLLPTEQILPNSIEVYEGVKYLLDNMAA